ncbi:hypothetical protein ACFLZY_02390 [Patescibacteria group bacterium]
MPDATVIDTQQAIDFASTLNWISPSWDLFIILFFVVASIVYGISLGRDRILITLVAVYMALAVVKHVPFITDWSAKININESVVLNISVFLGLSILIFFFVSHSALIKTLGSSTEQGKLWHIIVFSFLLSGLLISVTMSLFPQDVSPWLSNVTKTVFLNDTAKAVWIILPVLAMAFLKVKDKDD